jgi:hypothetical protein
LEQPLAEDVEQSTNLPEEYADSVLQSKVSKLPTERPQEKKSIIVKFPYGVAGAPITDAEFKRYETYKNKFSDKESF